jgi:SHS2 domain-containing protein
MNRKAGFQEIEHTADVEMHVWAPDMPGLLKQAAFGMYSISKIQIASEPRFSRELTLDIIDNESLIVDLLSELLFFVDHENIGFDDIQVILTNNQCRVMLQGGLIQELSKEIKAVTFHNLQVKESDIGLDVNVVFDV